MMSIPQRVFRHAVALAVVCAAMAGLAASPAQARVFIGIGVPLFVPGYYPAPYYYPPPVYYPPPPVVYTPTQTYTPAPGPLAPGAGQMCYAGPYTCPMDHPVAAGAGCYCLGNGGQRVWGKAN